MIDLAIIGGGPAGLSAGLYATRGGINNVVLFEKGAPGGQITGSSEIENYPGVKEIKSGIDFMDPWLEQCFRFGLKHTMSEVVGIEKQDDHFLIMHNEGKGITVQKAKSVIIATGGRPRRSGIKGESEFWGKGVSTCATCDAFFHKKKEVAVLGGGDTAIEEAIYLTKFASKVHVIHRRKSFRAAPITLEHARSNPNINFLTPCTVDEICGDINGVTHIKVKNIDDSSVIDLPVSAIFEFVGYEVNNQILQQKDGSYLCELDKSGNIIVDLKMNTSVKGLFAAGDIRIDAPKQVVCAAGDGALAALQAIDFLESH